MLVARVCQFYPQANGATVVSRFFWLMKSWKWPSPVMLKNIEVGKEKTWNPALYAGDRKNLMPIITPAYPSMCATYNVSKSGKTIILRELEAGNQLVQKIFENKLQWKDLFQKHSFFTKGHKYYLSVVASCSNKEEEEAWSGLVESKVRHLVNKLEEKADMIELARPFTKGFERTHRCKTDDEADAVKKGSVAYQVDETTTTESNNPQIASDNAQDGAVIPKVEDIKPETQASDESRTIYTTTFYVGIDLTPAATKNLNLSSAVDNFRDTCFSWAGFKKDMHELNVTPCKKYVLARP